MDPKVKEKALKGLEGLVRGQLEVALKDFKKPQRPAALATAVAEGTEDDPESRTGADDDKGDEGDKGAEQRGRTSESQRVLPGTTAFAEALAKRTKGRVSPYQYREYFMGRSRATNWAGRAQETRRKTIADLAAEGNIEPAVRTINFFKALFADDHAAIRQFGGKRVLGEATLAPGGGLVPEEFAQDVIGKMGDMTPLANRDFLRVVPMNSDRIIIPALSTLPVAIYGTENTAPAGQTEPAWKQIELVAREAVLLVPVSMYLIDDATVDLIQYLTDLFADALARLRNKKLLTGSGSQEPEGILTATGVTSTTYVTTNGGTKFDSVVACYHSIRPRYRDGAVWVMSDVALQTLSTIKDANNQPLLNQLADEPFPRLRGKPVFVTEAIESANPSRAVFGNWQYYLFGDRMAMVADTDRSGIYFQSRQVAIRVIERYDGRVAQSEAFGILAAIQ